MFRRNRTEDYDEYNERVNAKYDDDYVREEKEYRDECTHSHEQTYEDYTSVRECGHEHGQTYSNYTQVNTPDHDRIDTDRRSYDNVETTRSSGTSGDGQAKEFFERRLVPGEHILYVGKSRSAITGGGCVKAVIILFFLFFVNSFISAFLQGAMVFLGLSAVVPILLSLLLTIVLMVAALRKIGNASTDFCITNRRLLFASSNNVVPLNLRDIKNVSLTRTASSANSGNTREYVTYSHAGMNRVLDAGDDNYNVFRILQDAVKAAKEQRS